MKKAKLTLPSRAYQSPLREAQAALTRERILMAAKTYLENHDIETLSLRQLAELAGVSPPTVYAHFPTVDDLVGAFFAWLGPRLGLQQPVPQLDDFAALPKTLFPNYEIYGALLRNLMNKPSWDRQRSASAEQRHSRWISAVGEALPDLEPEQRRRGAMLISAFWTPTVWRWLMDTCGFTPKEAEQAAAWAIDALVGALKADASGLAGAPPDAPQGEVRRENATKATERKR